MQDFQTVAQHLQSDTAQWTHFLELCALGGRMAGSGSERAAQDWCFEQLSRIGPPVRDFSFPEHHKSLVIRHHLP